MNCLQHTLFRFYMGFSKEKTFNNVPTDFLGPPRPPQGPYKNKIVRKTRKNPKNKKSKNNSPVCPCEPVWCLKGAYGALREPMGPYRALCVFAGWCAESLPS